MQTALESIGDLFLGSVTLGERGQIVIPAEARADFGLKPGDKLLVFRHPKTNGLMIARVQDLEHLLADLTRFIEQLDVLTEENSDAS